MIFPRRSYSARTSRLLLRFVGFSQDRLRTYIILLLMYPKVLCGPTGKKTDTSPFLSNEVTSQNKFRFVSVFSTLFVSINPPDL
jgi:hypothetical protein